MKKALLAVLMAVTALTPMSSAIAAQPDHDGRGRGEGRAVTRTPDRDQRQDRRESRQESRQEGRGNRQEWRQDRKENRQESRQERRDNRRDWRAGPRDDRQDRRNARREVPRERDERRDDRRDWRETRGNDRKDWRDNRRDWRNDRDRAVTRDRWTDQRRWNSGWRDDRRYDWQRYRYSNRHIYRMPRYYAPRGWDYGYNRFSIGIFVGAPLYSQSYWIDDPWHYRLPPAYGSLRWVRYYDDALLIDIRDGYVVDVIHDFFD